MLNELFLFNLSEENRLRIEEQEKLWNYYSGNKTAIIEYLEDVMGINFAAEDIGEFQKVFINITKKIINQLSVVYKDPASRYFIDGEGNELEDFTEFYNSVLPVNINSIDKTALRYAKLFNTSITGIRFENGKIKYHVLPSNYYTVETQDEDIYSIKKLSYPKYFNDSGKAELFNVVWTDSEYYREPLTLINGSLTRGNKSPIPGNKDIRNKYGFIPYSVLRLEEQNDFWGNGQTDLVNINEQINFLLSDLINSGIVMQGWGTPMAVNCGLMKRTEKGTVQARRVRLGVKHPLIVEGVSKDDATPSLEFKNANPQISEVRTTIDWIIKMIALSKGLNPNSYVAEVNVTSGVSKLMDSLEQLEIRADDLEPCRIYEDDRYEKTQKILEFHKSEIKNYKKIDGYLVVDFAEVKKEKTLNDEIKESEFKLKYNLITPLDLMRVQNPDLTDEELKIKYIDNKTLNSELGISQVINPKAETSGGNFFKQDDQHSCGECVINSILSMYGKVLHEEMDTDGGTSPETIIKILSNNGIEASQVFDLDINELKPKSIIYYKDSDHYVTVETINENDVLINDSLSNAPETLTKEEIEKLWDNWAIETKPLDGGI